MAAQNIEEKNLKGSIFSIDVSKGPRLLSMRTGTACAVKREGSTRILLVTSSKVVQHLGDSSTQGNLSCKPFCPGFPVHEDKYIIKETIPPGNTEQFCYIPLQTAPKHCLELVSADKLREAGERLIQSSCLSYTFFGNCFKTMTWEFNEERQIHELTAVDPEGELVSSACRGSPVVSTEDEDRSVIGVVDCTSEGDLCLNFFKESSLDIGRSLDIKGGRPYVEILEQPKQRGLRFRYPCEGPSPGGLSGQYSEKGKKSHPSVQLCNYQGPARIVVSLVTVDEPPMPHAHSLIGKNSNNGVVTVQTGPELAMRACFPNLGIQHATRKIAGKVLMERYIKMHSLHTATLNAPTADDKAIDVAVRGDQALADGERATFDNNVAEAVTEGELQLVRQMVEEQMQNINLNAVRLCFQAYLPDDSGCFTKALRPCISNPVYNSKAPSASNLKICRMCLNFGCVTGGDEVYLLCDKVQKDDIEIVFYETDAETGKITWEGQGVFAPTDVHRQVAIVFRTPPYWNLAIERPAKVQLELRRKSDQETSEPVEFTYQPQMFATRRTVGGVRDVRHSPWIPSKSRTSVPPPVEKQLIEEGNSSSQGSGTAKPLSATILLGPLSHMGIQETEQSEMKFSMKRRSEENKCLWDQEVQCLESFQHLLTSVLKVNLDPKRELGGDYRSLAGALEKNMKYIWYLATTPSPIEELLRHSHLTLRFLNELLSKKEVDRIDVAKEIIAWVEKQGCSCLKCSSLR